VTFYATIAGDGVIAYRHKLAAQTLRGAKRAATNLLGADYRHHVLCVGELIDEYTPNERGRPLAERYLSQLRWRNLERGRP
jgi:hypothetical protein